MTLARIIWNNARQRCLSTVLTSLSVAVGVSLILAILTIKIVSQERLTLGYSGFDLVVGAKGSPLQLVLNVVYNLDSSPGNIPFALYQKLAKDPRVKLAVPFAVGDNYQGFRIVGTTDTFLKEFEPRRGEPFVLAQGRVFQYSQAEVLEAMKEAIEHGKEVVGETSTPESSKAGTKHEKKAEAPVAKGSHREHPHDDLHHVEPPHEDHGHHVERYEGVIGSTVAEQTGLKLGDTLVATHGIQQNDDGEKHEEHPWVVVGILKATGTPCDRAIYINLDSFYHIEGHVIEEKAPHAKELPKNDKVEEKDDGDPEPGQISSIALKVRSPIAVWALRKEINNMDDAQATVPSEEIRKLMTIVGNVDRILLAQAVLIVLVSAIGTALAMFNSMNERRRDIAVMRALGASRGAIAQIIMGEAVLIAGIGAVLGLLLGHVIIQAAAPAVQAAVGFTIPPWSYQPFEPLVLIGVLVVGVGAGAGPAISAYRTDVATGLSPNS